MILRLGRVARAALAVLGALLLLATILPPRWLVSRLAGEWNDPKGRVLIVLGNDSIDGKMVGLGSYWRTVYAVRAWQQGGFEHVILSGLPEITEPMREFLAAEGVPREAIVIEPRAASTRENAVNSVPVAQAFAGPYVLLTSDYHMWRADRAFRKAGLRVLPRPFPDAGKRLNTMRYRWDVFLDLAAESVKIAYYKARGWI